jgi:hypothetical protein
LVTGKARFVVHPLLPFQNLKKSLTERVITTQEHAKMKTLSTFSEKGPSVTVADEKLD